MLPEDRERAIEAITRALQEEDDLVLAYVFGSVADERATPSSDADVAVLATRPLGTDARKRLIQRLAHVTGRPIDLVDLREAGMPLLQIVLTEGREIICRDEAAKLALFTRMLADAEDFLPLRRRMLKERRERWIG